MRGLRIRPWLLEQKQRNPDSVAYYFNCNRCMREQPEQTRKHMGCGYLPPAADGAHVNAWDGTSLGRVHGADELDSKRRVRLPVCPGYVCGLPEVIEASWAHAYWEKGELTQWCEGQSTAELRDSIELLAMETAAASSWAMHNPVKK